MKQEKDIQQAARWPQLTILVCIFMACYQSGLGQLSGADGITTAIAGHQNLAVQEKVFVHTDKTFYLTGETIWLSAYVRDAATRQSSHISKVLYVELIDQKSRPALQAMLYVQQGKANGFLALPPSLASGVYQLRAYTALMRQDEEPLFFHTSLQVVNPAAQPDWALLLPKPGYAVQFFPEGGALVAGVQTKIGFQVVDQHGRGVDAAGFLVGGTNDSICPLRTHKFGLGSFDLKPAYKTLYEARFKLSNGVIVTASLPPALAQGYGLRVWEQDDRLLIQASRRGKAGAERLYLVAHSRQQVQFAASAPIQDSVEWNVDKLKLQEGITTITLFNEEGQPLCERLFFKHPTRQLNLDIHTDAVRYQSRSQIQLSVGASQQGKTSPAQLSVSVFLIDSLQGLPDASIEHYFWLTSELKGEVEAPGYYLGKGRNDQLAINNLLLTHGWRMFRPNVPALAQLPLPEYEGHFVKAKVVHKQTEAPAPGVRCYLTLPGTPFHLASAVSDSQGILHFLMKQVAGAAEFILQADEADSSLRIDLLDPYSPLPVQAKRPVFLLAQHWGSQLSDRYLGVQLMNAFLPSGKHRYQLPWPTNNAVFYDVPDRSYLLDEYTRFPTMEEVLREFVLETRVSKEKDVFSIKVLNLPTRTAFDVPPLLLFDGVPVFNHNKILAYDPLKLKKIEVVGRKFFAGGTVHYGVVSFQTYEGDLKDFELDPGVVLIEYNGLQASRSFYSPVYATPQQRASREPDKRNVLMWAPHLQAGNPLSFYSSDIPGRYAIWVQGISDDGVPGSRLKIIEVE